LMLIEFLSPRYYSFDRKSEEYFTVKLEIVGAITGLWSYGDVFTGVKKSEYNTAFILS